MVVTPAKRLALLVLPVVLLATTYAVYNQAAEAFGLKLGYFLGFLFYWVFWCLVVPLYMVGWPGLRSMFAQRHPALGRPAWFGAVMLFLPLAFGYAYAFPLAVREATFAVVVSSVLIAVINGTAEEVLWRGVYTLAFPERSTSGWLYGYLLPSVGFAVWHFAPQSLSPSGHPGGAWALVVFALFLGLAWGWVARKTGSIRWVALVHILFDLSGLGGRIYF